MVTATKTKTNGRINGNGRISHHDSDGTDYHWGRWIQLRADMLGYRRALDIAEHVGCSRQQLGRWFNMVQPPLRMRRGLDEALCRVMELDRQELFTDWHKHDPYSLLRKYGGRGRYANNANVSHAFPDLRGEEDVDGDRIGNMDARYGVPVSIGTLMLTPRGDAVLVGGTTQLAILKDEDGYEFCERWGVLNAQVSGPAFDVSA